MSQPPKDSGYALENRTSMLNPSQPGNAPPPPPEESNDLHQVDPEMAALNNMSKSQLDNNQQGNN
jgi:hypothetical protein